MVVGQYLGNLDLRRRLGVPLVRAVAFGAVTLKAVTIAARFQAGLFHLAGLVSTPLGSVVAIGVATLADAAKLADVTAFLVSVGCVVHKYQYGPSVLACQPFQVRFFVTARKLNRKKPHRS